MNASQQADLPPRFVKSHPRQPNRTLLLLSVLALCAWLVFLLLVAL